ncbi:MAG: translation initiation factor IF-2 [Nanoarchaeota archaeon]|nr:translation initiation factor IF-2 [Nanoarchaeota archaeon]MBU4456875.1 translation initiation factor IF-2 [Nanoarchaeota archaeon]
MLRQPICVFMGHIDHGKTSIADQFRHTAVTKTEAGAITQMISSSVLSIESIKKTTKHLLNANSKFTIPGLLLIDTPGHSAFTNLRKRGGNLADIAVLVININEGIMEQTLECLEILKQYKTPFIIALNKIDLLPGWRTNNINMVDSINLQSQSVIQLLDTKLYELVGKLYEKGFQADRFDRIDDYTKQIAMIPCSAKTSEGIPELMMVLIGLAQKFLEENLKVDMNTGKGTILEVKDEKGVGTTLDIILYDGVLKSGDTIVIGGLNEPIVTKVRGLFLPEKGKMKSVKEVVAAAGVRIFAPDLNEVISGVPLMVAHDDLEEVKAQVQAEVDEVMTEIDNEGVVIKAESLGSLEALIKLLKEKDIPIKKASVGEITKKDIADASAEDNFIHKVILAFNVKEIENSEIKIISHDIIYRIIEDYEKWVIEQKKKEEEESLKSLTRPAKIEIIKGCIFRQSNPAVVGVRVLSGTLKPNVGLIKLDGSKAGTIKTIQLEKESLKEAKRGKEVAISLPGITAKKQVDEEDVLIVDVPESDFKQLKKFKKLLSMEEKDLLRELSELKRKDNEFWGV